MLSDTFSLSKNGIVNRLGISDNREYFGFHLNHPVRGNSGIPFSFDIYAGLPVGKFLPRIYFANQFSINGYRSFSVRTELLYKFVFKRQLKKPKELDILMDDSESSDAEKKQLQPGAIFGFRKHILNTPFESYRLYQYEKGINLEFMTKFFQFSFTFSDFSYSTGASDLKYFLQNNQYMLILINAEQAVSEIYSFPDFTISFSFAYQLSSSVKIFAGFQMSWLMVNATEVNTRYLGVEVSLGDFLVSLTYMNSYFEYYLHSLLFGFKVVL